MTPSVPSAKRIGLLGGSFDPVHYGHLQIARDAIRLFNLYRVLFIPAPLPPHKQQADLSPVEDRLAMLEAALASDPRFSVSRIETERPGPSYTVDTLRRLKDLYPREQLVFIIGLDTLLDLPNWKDIETVFQLCEFAVLSRPGWDPSGLDALPFSSERIHQLRACLRTGTEHPAASSDVRAMVRDHRDITGLVPECVSAYIEAHHLYQA